MVTAPNIILTIILSYMYISMSMDMSSSPSSITFPIPLVPMVPKSINTSTGGEQFPEICNSIYEAGMANAT